MSEYMLELTRSSVAGIPSYCTANPIALEVCMKSSLKSGKPVLIEATANQVNQFGGYTGMRPADYAGFVRSIAFVIVFQGSAGLISAI